MREPFSEIIQSIEEKQLAGHRSNLFAIFTLCSLTDALGFCVSKEIRVSA